MLLASLILAASMSGTQCTGLADLSQIIAMDRDKGVPMQNEEMALSQILLNTPNDSEILDQIGRTMVQLIYQKLTQESPDQVHDNVLNSCLEHLSE